MGNVCNLRYSRLTRATPRRQARARWDFIFDLEHARVERKLRRRLPSITMPEEEGTFDSVSAHLLATAANIFGWAADRTKGGLRRGKCKRDKQALQIFLARLQLDDADDVVVYTEGSKTPRPCC